VHEPTHEVDVAPAQREQLALAQTGVGGHAEDRRVLRVGRVRREQLDLVGLVGLELARVDDARALHEVGRGGVPLEPPHAAGALEDAVQHRQVTHDHARRHAPLAHQPHLVGVHVVGRDRLDRAGAELREEVALHDAAVVARRLAVHPALLLDVAQVLGGGVRERGARAPGARKLAPPRVGQDLGEPLLGHASGEVARLGAALLRPRGAEPLLDLPSVGQAVLHVPLGPALPLPQAHVARHAGGATLVLHRSSLLRCRAPGVPAPRGRLRCARCYAEGRQRRDARPGRLGQRRAEPLPRLGLLGAHERPQARQVAAARRAAAAGPRAAAAEPAAADQADPRRARRDGSRGGTHSSPRRADPGGHSRSIAASALAALSNGARGASWALSAST
jgi:hypothetical protein